MFKKVIIICILLCVPRISFSDDVVTDLAIHKFQLEGITYIGFLVKDAQTLLQYRIDIPKLKLSVEKRDEKIKNNQLQIETLTSANSTLLEIKDVLVASNAHLQQELASRDAWYRSPYFTFCVGLLMGTAITVAAVYFIK
jgi:hypothetical protein